VTYSGQAEWNSSTDGSWNTNGNWVNTSSGANIAPPGLRGIAGDTILFASAAGNVARLDGADPSIAAMTFNNAATGYTIAQGSGGSLTLQGGGAPSGSATVSVLAGNHAIRAPLQLAGNTIFSAAAASSLTVNGAIDGSGSLTVNGGGKIYLSGNGHYTGNTSVASGALIVTTVTALPDGGNIVVGSESLFESAAAATGGLTTSSAIPPATSSTSTNLSPTIPRDRPPRLQSTTSAVNKGPVLPPAGARGPKLTQAWLSAIAQFWSEQRQSVGPAKARAVDIVMMTRNTGH
jgi:autotransporter-associated beta strand protein